ncbi:MAG: T9SS type A sorting domain-containing protein [Flavobacteriales bacterium]|nr:T9SS type A sorting domain-containing protein [Flavobacteriales bacterium]
MIFPNPSDGQFTIEGNSSKGYNVEAFNSLGQPVFSTQFNSTDKISIELPTAGIYHLVVRTDEMIYTEKVVVQ